MATDLTDFLPQIQPHVGGCPESVILESVRSATIRLCNESWLIRENITGDVIATVDDYTMTASTNNDICGLISFIYNDRTLAQKTEEEVDELDPGWRTAESGYPLYVMAPEPNRFLLNRKPSAAIVGGLKVRVATRPTDTATVVNDILYNNWRETIAHGALEKLYALPKKGWSDMKQSVWYGRRFVTGIQVAKIQAVKGNIRTSTTAKMRAW